MGGVSSPPPILADQVITGAVWLVTKGGEHLVRCLSAIQRRNQRLHDGNRAVKSASVAPRLQVVCFIDMPVRERRGFVVVETVMDPVQKRFRSRKRAEREVGS